jgi:cobalamin biosynthesis protein CobT
MRFDDNNNKIDEEEEEDSESDESEDDESESDESDEEDESEEEDSESDDEEKTVENIVLEETEVLANESSEQIKVVNVDLNEVEVTPVSEPVEELLVEKVEVPTVINDAETAEEKRENALEVYRKMSLPALKTLLITKGLSSDPSKMKKYDILYLLEKNLDQ